MVLLKVMKDIHTSEKERVAPIGNIREPSGRERRIPEPLIFDEAELEIIRLVRPLFWLAVEEAAKNGLGELPVTDQQTRVVPLEFLPILRRM